MCSKTSMHACMLWVPVLAHLSVNVGINQTATIKAFETTQTSDQGTIVFETIANKNRIAIGVFYFLYLFLFPEQPTFFFFLWASSAANFLFFFFFLLKNTKKFFFLVPVLARDWEENSIYTRRTVISDWIWLVGKLEWILIIRREKSSYFPSYKFYFTWHLVGTVKLLNCTGNSLLNSWNGQLLDFENFIKLQCIIKI